MADFPVIAGVGVAPPTIEGGFQCFQIFCIGCRYTVDERADWMNIAFCIYGNRPDRLDSVTCVGLGRRISPAFSCCYLCDLDQLNVVQIDRLFKLASFLI
jgi:hypothetical protein